MPYRSYGDWGALWYPYSEWREPTGGWGKSVGKNGFYIQVFSGRASSIPRQSRRPGRTLRLPFLTASAASHVQIPAVLILALWI